MCGITGYVSSGSRSLEKAINVLGHRGPDDKGSYTTSCNDLNIGLGHTRLSIIDLSEQGHQPMSSSDGKVQFVFNGEIYNFRELKQAHFSPDEFQSSTDTEVILKLYLKFGKDFVTRLNGDFAIAIADLREKKVLLFRDRAGVKPLYYSLRNNDLLFASEIKSLLQMGLQPALNENLLQHYFTFKYTPQNNTLFRHVNRLQPGHFLEYDLEGKSVDVKRYWSPSAREEYRKMSYSEAQEELFRLLEDSVNKRLVSDVPVGTFLSGGLDSSIIASFLKEHDEIRHYCAVKSEKDLKKEGTTSDSRYAKKLAGEWDLNFHELPVGSDQATKTLIDKTVFYGDDLIADGSQIPSYLITQKASSTSKVVLSGMGADELFFGYAGHMISRLSLYLNKLPFDSSIARAFSKISQGKGFGKAYRRYLHKMGKYHNYPHYRYGMYSIVGDFENSASVYPHDTEGLINTFETYFPSSRDPFACLMDFEYENFLVKNLHYSDRMSMANSVEMRVPFLDHRIIELAWSLPEKYKLSPLMNSKRILKDTFRNVLPDYILKRRKAGFGMPLRSIFSSRENIDKLMTKEFFEGIDGFSMDAIEQNIQMHLNGKEDNSSIIYALISFERWYRQFFEGDGGST